MVELRFVLEHSDLFLSHYFLIGLGNDGDKEIKKRHLHEALIYDHHIPNHAHIAMRLYWVFCMVLFPVFCVRIRNVSKRISKDVYKVSYLPRGSTPHTHLEVRRFRLSILQFKFITIKLGSKELEDESEECEKEKHENEKADHVNHASVN